MRIPVIQSRRINKILCLVTLAMALAMILIGGIYWVIVDKDIAKLLCMVSIIPAGFSLFYGILWFICGRKEQKRQKKIERVAELLAEPADNVIDYHDFYLPKEALTEAARKRFRDISLGLAVAGVAIFTVLYIVLLFINGYQGIGHLISMVVFCMLMVIPGTIVQYVIYHKYAATVPERISLFPGKIIVDGHQISIRDIENITISSYKSLNQESPSFYRKMVIRTSEKIYEYTIDYRGFSDGQPRWNQYGELLTALRKWAAIYRVKLTIDYMN